ncbi:MAG: hypothetical protein WAM17_14230 [Rhodoplanes sp.]
MFFQTLGVAVRARGFRLSTGDWYLPDFRVRLADGLLWAEVKPEGAPIDLFERFCNELPVGARAAVLNEIPDPEDVVEGQECGYFDVCLSSEYWSNGHQFCICPRCDAIGFEYAGMAARIKCACVKTADLDPTLHIPTYDHPHILAAYAAARSARFEHGERGEGSL